jgi:hypothetical protein
MVVGAYRGKIAKKIALIRYSVGMRLPRPRAVLDHGNSPDDVDGRSVVGEFGDRSFLLDFYHPLGRGNRGGVGRGNVSRAADDS